MRQKPIKVKIRSIDNPTGVLNESIVHSFSESEPCGLIAAIGTHWSAAPDQNHI